jgi:hypothetical protein
VYTWSDGSTFSGSWELGQRCGHGIVTLASGDCYDGEWVNNVANGRGKFVSVEVGVSRVCDWVDGEPVETAVYIQPRVLKSAEEATKAGGRKNSTGKGGGGKAVNVKKGSKGPVPEKKDEDVGMGPVHVTQSTLPVVDGADPSSEPSLIIDANLQLRHDVVDSIEEASVNATGEEQPRLYASLAVPAGGPLPDLYLCVTDILGRVVTEESGRQLFAAVTYTPPPEAPADKKPDKKGAKAPPPIMSADGMVRFGLLPKAPATYALKDGIAVEPSALELPKSRPGSKGKSRGGTVEPHEDPFPGVPPIDATLRISVTTKDGLVHLSGMHLHPACTPGAVITIEILDGSIHKQRKDGLPVGIPRVTQLPGGTLRVLVEDAGGGVVAVTKKKK